MTRPFLDSHKRTRLTSSVAKDRFGGRIGHSEGNHGYWATVPYYYLYPKASCRGGWRTELYEKCGTTDRVRFRYTNIHHQRGMPYQLLSTVCQTALPHSKSSLPPYLHPMNGTFICSSVHAQSSFYPSLPTLPTSESRTGFMKTGSLVSGHSTNGNDEYHY